MKGKTEMRYVKVYHIPTGIFMCLIMSIALLIPILNAIILIGLMKDIKEGRTEPFEDIFYEYKLVESYKELKR